MFNKAKSLAMFNKATIKPQRTAETSDRRSPSKIGRAHLTLSRLICTRRWDAVMRVLTSDEEIEIDENGAINEENILHFALSFHAPLQVVILLSNRYPLCLNKPDLSGKFCTHVAAKYSAHPDVMAFIISKNPAAAGCPDNKGKCPIHYIAEFYVKHGSLHHKECVDELMLDTVRLLRQAAPQSFNLEDQEERNPIEYAIENDADIRVIKMMQRTARDDWREMKQSGYGMKHEDLAKSIEKSAKEAREKSLENGSRFERTQPILIPKEEQSRRAKKSFIAKSA